MQLESILTAKIRPEVIVCMALEATQGYNHLTFQNTDCVKKIRAKIRKSTQKQSICEQRVIFSHFLVTRRVNCKLQLFSTVLLKGALSWVIPTISSQGCFPQASPPSSLHGFLLVPAQMEDACANAVPVTFPVFLQPSLASSFPHLTLETSISHPTTGERVICSQVSPQFFHHYCSIV